MKKRIDVIMTLITLSTTIALAGPQQNHVVGQYESLARKQVTDFDGFSATRGENLFRESYGKGKPDTPSCTTCHSTSPEQAGRTRAGKVVAPMALSHSPERYADFKKTEKWFRRNCRSVLGRECTPIEKGDFIIFMTKK